MDLTQNTYTNLQHFANDTVREWTRSCLDPTNMDTDKMQSKNISLQKNEGPTKYKQKSQATKSQENRNEQKALVKLMVRSKNTQNEMVRVQTCVTKICRE